MSASRPSGPLVYAYAHLVVKALEKIEKSLECNKSPIISIFTISTLIAGS